MSTVPAISASPLATDLPCAHCHYNLRTLLPTANCPECNHPIADSIAHHAAHEKIRLPLLDVALILLAITILLDAVDLLFPLLRLRFFNLSALNTALQVSSDFLILAAALLLVFLQIPPRKSAGFGNAMGISLVAFAISFFARLIFPYLFADLTPPGISALAELLWMGLQIVTAAFWLFFNFALSVKLKNLAIERHFIFPASILVPLTILYGFFTLVSLAIGIAIFHPRDHPFLLAINYYIIFTYLVFRIVLWTCWMTIALRLHPISHS